MQPHMMSHLERDAGSSNFHFEAGQVSFSLANQSKEVFDTLTMLCPQLVPVLETLTRGIPLPRTAAPNLQGNFYRLPNHNRSYCYRLVHTLPLVDSPVVVIKGAEPLLQDFPLMIDWMLQAPLRQSSRVMADHFPLAEGKIPGALSAKEAMHEAHIALAVQKRHLVHYGELAAIPVPLLIHCIRKERYLSCFDTLRKRLSQSAFDRIEPLLQNGLAIYVYYYPSPPIRANYFGDLGLREFKAFGEKKRDEHSCISRWARLLIRLLYLGYLPYSVRNDGLGACMDFGNASVDGGFCDPDSIVPIDSSVDNEFFSESVIQTFRIFQNTVERFLAIAESTSLYPSIESFACGQYIDHLLKDAIETEGRPSLHLDSRLMDLMFPKTVTDVRGCTRRKPRSASYAYFTRQSRAEHLP
jgi:hypothetical protein